MQAQRFSARNRFHWQDTVYEIKRRLPAAGQVSIEDVFTGTIQAVDLLVLVKALFDGELRFVVEGQHPKPGTEDSTEDKYADLADYPEHLVCIARYRLDIIRPLLALDITPKICTNR